MGELIVTILIIVGLVFLISVMSFFLILLMYSLIRLVVTEIEDIVSYGINLDKSFKIGASFCILLIGLFFSYQSVLFALRQGEIALELQENRQETSQIAVLPQLKKSSEQLFDINFEIDDSSIKDINELSSRTIFVSFGTVPTPVDLIFDILDESGQAVYTWKDHIIVETEMVFTKKFKGLSLGSGKYTLVLNTLYNVDVKDEFRQEFEITSDWKSISSWIMILILAVLSLALVIIRRIMFERRIRNYQ